MSMRRNIFLDPTWDLKKRSGAEDFVFMKDFEYKTDALKVVEAMASFQRDAEKSAGVGKTLHDSLVVGKVSLDDLVAHEEQEMLLHALMRRARVYGWLRRNL